MKLWYESVGKDGETVVDSRKPFFLLFYDASQAATYGSFATPSSRHSFFPSPAARNAQASVHFVGDDVVAKRTKRHLDELEVRPTPPFIANSLTRCLLALQLHRTLL